MHLRSFATAALLAASAVLAACTDSTRAAGGRPVSVSFATAAMPGASFSLASAPGLSRSVTATSGANTLIINSAQLVVARMELERAPGSCGSSSAAGDDESIDENECGELELAPTVVDLPVDAAVVSVLNVMIPAGSYSALSAKIRPIRADGDHGKGSAAFLAAHPELAGASVIVKGKYNTVDFTYIGTPRAEFETSFHPPLVVDAKPVNVTVNVNLASWFMDGMTLIDPSTANAGGVNERKVADNIKRSFRAFHDDNHDGKDDDGDHN